MKEELIIHDGCGLPVELCECPDVTEHITCLECGTELVAKKGLGLVECTCGAWL